MFSENYIVPALTSSRWMVGETSNAEFHVVVGMHTIVQEYV